MPSRPLSPDRQAITQLHTRIDVEAIAVTRADTDRGAAVARLATLVPPTRVDLVDEVMTRIGTRTATGADSLEVDPSKARIASADRHPRRIRRYRISRPLGPGPGPHGRIAAAGGHAVGELVGVR